MKIVVSPEDFIELITPINNGCGFKVIIDKSGKAYITFGCCALINLMSGFKRLIRDDLYEEAERRGFYEPYSLTPRESRIAFYENCVKRLDALCEKYSCDYHETLIALLAVTPCTQCGGLMMEKKTN